MSNQEILEKAIKLAIDGGWEPEHPVYGPTYKGNWWPLADATEDIPRYFDPLEYDSLGYECLIFNQDFARSLWGEQTTKIDNSGNYTPNGMEFIDRPGWQHHLQQMVIAEDPILYLGEHLDA